MIPNIFEDPHLELLQRVTAQLDDQEHNPCPAMKRECKKHNLCKGLQQEGKSTLAGTVGRTDMVCIFAPTQEGTLGMAREEDLEDN